MKILLITLINLGVVSLVVTVHYEALLRISLLLPKLRISPRLKVVTGIIGAFAAHIIEIWIFAIAFYLLILHGDFGRLVWVNGSTPGSGLLDCFYFSMINYTSIGYGDIVPMEEIRFLSGLEGLIGLLLIAWTASFMYNEMRLYWKS